MTYPNFNVGETLRAADMNAVGLWLVKSQTIGTGVSTVVVSSAFSSTYDSYRIVFSNVTMSSTATSTYVALKMHDGTNPANSNYNTGFVRVDLANGNTSGNVATLASIGVIIGYGTGDKFGTSIDVINPNIATHTLFPSVSGVNSSTGYMSMGAGMHQTSTAYTGIQIAPSTGTLTGGTIAVYGYKK
jgi:hypothetical protein